MEGYLIQAWNVCQLFYEMMKNMLYNLGSKHDNAINVKGVTTLERLKSCCHHSLGDPLVYTDGA